MARHAARRIAMQMIYARLLGGADCVSVLAEEPDYLNIGEDADYLSRALDGTAMNQQDYDNTIARLSPKRALERIPLIDRAILHLAMHEMGSAEAADEVIVNEAVEMAKRFGDEADSRFINGVLGSFIRERQ
jgi:N utilization substance protein B